MSDTAFDLDPSAILDAGNAEPIEQPIDETPLDEPLADDTLVDEPSQPGETPAEGEDTEGGDEESKDGDKKDFSKGDDDVDLRKAAKEIRDGLNKLREIDPKGAKLLRQALGHDLAYQETFKTPEEARVFKASVDAVGGPEGIAQLQDHSARYLEQETLSESGDPSLVKSYAKDFPEGFKKAAPVMLDELRSLDKEAYAKVILPHLIDSLDAAGVGNVFASLQEAAQNGDTETIKKIAANLTQWFGGQTSAAKNLRQALVNPEMDKVNAERAALNTEREQMFDTQWRKPVGDNASAKIYQTGEPFIRAVPVGQQRVFFQEVIKEINARVTGDKTYMSQENALMKSKTRDINKIIAFKNAKIETVVQGAVEKVAKDFGYKQGVKPTTAPKTAGKPGATKPVTGAGATPQTAIFVKDKPQEADRDKEKMGKNYVDHVIAGRSLMKSGPYKGRWVTWRGAKTQA